MNETEIKAYIENLKGYLVIGLDPEGNILTWDKYEAISAEIKQFENYFRLKNSKRLKLKGSKKVSYNKEIIRTSANWHKEKKPVVETNMQSIDKEGF